MPTYPAADGAELSYEDGGPPGTLPLLLVHGWQADARIWGPLSGILAARYRVVAPDLRGAGGSNRASGPYTLEQFAADLGDLVDVLGLDPVVVVGHSMGGAIAQRFAIERPEAVEGLVLVAAVPASGVPFPPKVIDFFRGTCGNPEQTALWLKGLTFRELDPDDAQLLRAAAATVPAEAALESFESWQAADFADEAATIETPTLVLAPSDDRPMTPEFLRERIADVIAGSNFEILAECGHYAPIDRPVELAAAIESFIEDL